MKGKIGTAGASGHGWSGLVIPGGPKDRIRNLKIPGSMLSHRPGMTIKISDLIAP
jgi:hypothetical protein